MSTFVSLGNATQPFPRLLEAVAKLAPDLPQPVTVQYGNNKFACSGCRPVDFLAMDSFMTHIREADVLILHAGAGTVVNAVQAGKIPVIAPRRAQNGEHIDDHQVEFARALGATGRVVVVDDMAQLGSAVKEARLRQAGHLPSMRSPPLVSMIARVLAGYAEHAG